jgi:hypothetical protein
MLFHTLITSRCFFWRLSFVKPLKRFSIRAYHSDIQAPPSSRIRVFFESMLVAYVDPNMPRLLKKFKCQTLHSWTEDTTIHAIREAVLALMHEWTQVVEDTTAAPGFQRLDEMTQKM